MKKEGLYDKHGYQILLTLLPSMSIMLLLYNSLNVQLNSILLGILLVLWLVTVRVLDYYKSHIIAKIAMLCLVLGTVAVVIYNIEALLAFKDKLQLVANGGLLSSSLSKQELFVLTLILIPSIALPLYVMQKIKIVRIVMAAVILVLLLAQATQGKLLPLYAIAYFLIYSFLVLGETLVVRYITYRKIDGKRVMLHIAPLMLLFILLVTYMPVSEKPVTIHETIYNGIKTTVTNFYHDIRYWLSKDHGEYGVNMIGYSEVAGFDEIGEKDPQVSLQISSKNPLGQRVYLRGNWKNIYTGQNWTEKVEKTNIYDAYSEYSLDWTELLYAMYRYDKLSSLEKLARIDNMDVVYKDIETSSMFFPLKTTNIVAGMTIDTMTPENVNFGVLMREGTRYMFSTLKLNHLSKEWKAFISQAQNYTYSSLHTVDMQDFRNRIKGYDISIGLDSYFTSEDILYKRASYIRDEYTKLPENLPKRVGELSQKITQGLETPLEQCEAIEAYLKTFDYIQKPKPVAEDKDLVDSFLFETREGYCTYFASAMAVMVRTLGIPSRYVQGFAVGTGLNPNSKYQVLSTSAHAWVEVYLEGIGWMTYDPTPASGIGLSENYMWDMDGLVVVSGVTEDTKGIKLKNEDIRAYYESLAKSKAEEQKGETQKFSLLNYILVILLGMVVAGFLIGILYALIRITKNRRLFRKLSSNDTLYAVMAQIFFLLEAQGTPIEDTETIYQYFKRIDKARKNQTPSLMEVEAIYTSVRYSNKEVVKEELDKVIELRQVLLQELKSRNLYSYSILWITYSMRSFT